MSNGFKRRRDEDVPAFFEQKDDGNGGGFHHQLEAEEDLDDNSTGESKEKIPRLEKEYIPVLEEEEVVRAGEDDYCFLCIYTAESYTSEDNPYYERLVAYLRTHIGKIRYKDLCRSAQVIYNRTLRKSVNEEHQGLEWRPSVIEDHLRYHTKDPLATDLHTLSVYQQLCIDMEQNELRYIDPTTGKKKVDHRTLASYFRLNSHKRNLQIEIEKQRRIHL